MNFVKYYVNNIAYSMYCVAATCCETVFVWFRNPNFSLHFDAVSHCFKDISISSLMAMLLFLCVHHCHICLGSVFHLTLVENGCCHQTGVAVIIFLKQASWSEESMQIQNLPVFC